MKTSHAALVKDVERFPSLGIVGEGGVGLDGWVVTRDDGSISVLHVMDSCRRKGYAQVSLLHID